MNLIEIILGTAIGSWVHQSFFSDSHHTNSLKDTRQNILDQFGGVDPRDIVPKCKHCNNWCMLPLPDYTPTEVIDGLEPVSFSDPISHEPIVPTCAKGQRFNLRKTGYNYDIAKYRAQQARLLNAQLAKEAKRRKGL